MILGQRIGGDPEDEAEHFMQCPVCHEMFDMRDLEAVLYHDQPEHERREEVQ